MGAPKSRPRESTGRTLHPTGTHGLVARHYEPLADSHAGTHGPAKPCLLQSLQKTNGSPPGLRFGFWKGVGADTGLRCRSTPPDKRCYLTSTFAPASSIFFLMVSASTLLTASLMGFGAPSTRSLASFKPRP